MRYDGARAHRPAAMEFAFILDPLASLKAYKDTSVAMMRALATRGHALFAMEQRDLFWDGRGTRATVRPLTVSDDEHHWFETGAAVVRVREDDPNRNVIVETVGLHGTRTVMAQRFIPEIVDGDKRILLIAGEPVPHALARIPKPGETRGNLAAGGRGVARPLSSRDRQIAEAVGAKLWAEGMLVVGLDVIGDYLTEVNVTSPTGFVEITQQTGFDVAGRFADALADASR